MPPLSAVPPALQRLIDRDDGVLTLATALEHLSRDAVRWRVTSGRWQEPCRRILVASNAPLTLVQRQRVAVLWGGPRAALAGLTAARLGGLAGFDQDIDVIHLLRPSGRHLRRGDPPAGVVLHTARDLGDDVVQPNREPKRTRMARSLVDAAEWMATDRGAQAILAAGVQQGLAPVDQLRAEADRGRHRRRRPLIQVTLRDIQAGSRALSELDFMRLVVRQFGLPEPDQQVPWTDAGGKTRYLDAAWKWAQVAVEVDGAGHMDAIQYWDDMDRDNQLKLYGGYTVLRFPAWAVRQCPEKVAAQIQEALAQSRRSGRDHVTAARSGRR